jgi:hypothetical protein
MKRARIVTVAILIAGSVLVLSVAGTQQPGL